MISLLVTIVSLVVFWIGSVRKMSWLSKLQAMVIFGASFWGTVFSYTSIEIPQPLITPGNVGIIRERPETIKISAEDGLEIYYTIDGSDPKELEQSNNSHNMTNSVTCTLDKSTVVSARTKFWFLWSDVTERTYTFVKPPITNTMSAGSSSLYLENDMGNGGEFLFYDNGYIFRKYNFDSFEDGFFGFSNAPYSSMKKIAFMSSDGTVEELFNDDGYGPLYFARGNLFMTKYKENDSCIYSVNLSGNDAVQYGKGEIIGIDDMMRYIICKDGQTVYTIDTDSHEITFLIEATGGVMGFHDNSVYYAICVETGEKGFDNKYILQLRKWSFENQQETNLAYLTYTASTLESMPIIEKAQFSDDYVYFSYGTRGGSLCYYTGYVARLNLFTYEMEKIIENLSTSDFLVTNVDNEPYLYYFGDSEECVRINIDSRVVNYPSAWTLDENDVFEDENGLCIYGKNNTKFTLISSKDYEAYGYKKGQLGQYMDEQYFVISEINEFPDKIFFRIDIGFHDPNQDVGWRTYYVRTKTKYYYKEIYTEKNVLIYEI